MEVFWAICGNRSIVDVLTGKRVEGDGAFPMLCSGQGYAVMDIEFRYVDCDQIPAGRGVFDENAANESSRAHVACASCFMAVLPFPAAPRFPHQQ